MLRDALKVLGAAAIAFIVGLYWSIGFGVGDGFRAILIDPSVIGVLPFVHLFAAGFLVGLVRKRPALVAGVIAVYLGLVVGRLAEVAYLGSLDMGAALGSVAESLTLGFTVDAAVYSDPILKTADPAAFRFLGVLLQVLASGFGISVARWTAARSSKSARLA